MRLNLTVLYRGRLSSCNYDCPYCPFGKHWESPEELREDQDGLERFCGWAERRTNGRIAVFFTPWGEALVRSWYREAIVRLSRLDQVTKVAVQTNLSSPIDWLRSARIDKLGLWCTYHPGQVEREAFVAKSRRLTQLGVRHSVGCVGLREHLAEAQALRREVAPTTYVWINAYKSGRGDDDPSLVDAFTRIDPLFPINNMRHGSRGRSCRTGHTVITVDSRGDARRCHFVHALIGNIHDPRFEDKLAPAPCPNATCDCHIGYVHLEHLGLDHVFGQGILERVPDGVDVPTRAFASTSPE